MIAFALLRPFLPYIIGGAVVTLAAAIGGAWWKYHADVEEAYLTGKKEIQSLWDQTDRVAVAIGVAESALLAKGAQKEAEELRDELQTIKLVAERRGAALSARTALADSLQQRLDARAAVPASTDPATASCRGIEERLRRCEGLVAEANQLATGADGMAEEARSLLEVGEARLQSMRDWSALVLLTQEAP